MSVLSYRNLDSLDAVSSSPWSPATCPLLWMPTGNTRKDRETVTKPWFLLRPNGYVKFCTTTPRFSFPSELQEGRLNLELCWAGNRWFNFPKALFQILFYFPELTHWTPNPRRSLEKAEHGCLCLFLLGWIQQWNSFQALISWGSTSEHSKLWGFLRYELQIAHLELVSPHCLPSVWEVYQFSWRGSTIPLALDAGVTHCKPFRLWKHQSQKSQPDSLGAWLRVRVEPVCEVRLISCGGQMIQAMFLLRAGVRGAMIPHGWKRVHTPTDIPIYAYLHTDTHMLDDDGSRRVGWRGDFFFLQGTQREIWERLRCCHRSGIKRLHMDPLCPRFIPSIRYLHTHDVIWPFPPYRHALFWLSDHPP